MVRAPRLSFTLVGWKEELSTLMSLQRKYFGLKKIFQKNRKPLIFEDISCLKKNSSITSTVFCLLYFMNN